MTRSAPESTARIVPEQEFHARLILVLAALPTNEIGSVTGPVADKPEELRRLAMSPDGFTTHLFFLAEGEAWAPPAGAYKRCGGPT